MTAYSPQPLIFLKLGGSLITEKDHPHTPRPKVIRQLCAELADGWHKYQGQLLLGHGSGSYGHVPAREFGTRDGVHNQEGWRGFIEVWREAAELNRLVMEALGAAGLPAVVFPPSACLTANDGKLDFWDIQPIKAALAANLLPVIYGDVVFDRVRGGTILSTEELFNHLTMELHPKRILLAGIEPGVWLDYEKSEGLIPKITPADIGLLKGVLAGSKAADVTGGMASKVLQNIELVQRCVGLQVQIFSAQEPGALRQALNGDPLGTLILND